MFFKELLNICFKSFLRIWIRTNTAADFKFYTVPFIDVDDFDFDIAYAIEKFRYEDEHSEGIDTSKAALYLEDRIISEALDEIDTKLSELPMDIETYCDYTARVSFSIYGVEDIVNSYLENDEYADYHEHYGNYNDADSEIDYIFGGK